MVDRILLLKVVQFPYNYTAFHLVLTKLLISLPHLTPYFDMAADVFIPTSQLLVLLAMILFRRQTLSQPSLLVVGKKRQDCSLGREVLLRKHNQLLTLFFACLFRLPRRLRSAVKRNKSDENKSEKSWKQNRKPRMRLKRKNVKSARLERRRNKKSARQQKQRPRQHVHVKKLTPKMSMLSNSLKTWKVLSRLNLANPEQKKLLALQNRPNA